MAVESPLSEHMRMYLHEPDSTQSFRSTHGVGGPLLQVDIPFEESKLVTSSTRRPTENTHPHSPYADLLPPERSRSNFPTIDIQDHVTDNIVRSRLGFPAIPLTFTKHILMQEVHEEQKPLPPDLYSLRSPFIQK